MTTLSRLQSMQFTEVVTRNACEEVMFEVEINEVGCDEEPLPQRNYCGSSIFPRIRTPSIERNAVLTHEA